MWIYNNRDENLDVDMNKVNTFHTARRIMPNKHMVYIIKFIHTDPDNNITWYFDSEIKADEAMSSIRSALGSQIIK